MKDRKRNRKTSLRATALVAMCLCHPSATRNLAINAQKRTRSQRFAKQRSSPLKMDPTRTSTLRYRFMAQIRRRFKLLQDEVKDFLVTKDALGLAPEAHRITTMAAVREFQFHTDPDKLKAFNDWFRQQVEANIFSVSEVPGQVGPTGPWTRVYIESAYKRGLVNAYLQGKNGGIVSTTQEQFLRSSFNTAEVQNKIELIATRSFEDLKGITATMSSKLNQILAAGLIDGRGPEAIAKDMVEQIGSLTEARALTIARTEVINAHAEGQLDGFEDLGVGKVGVKAEWTTAGDDRVCPECEDYEGKVFDIEDARGLIPLHPNCRCSWTPVIE